MATLRSSIRSNNLTGQNTLKTTISTKKIFNSIPIPGLNHIFDGKGKIYSFLWFSILLLSSCACCYQTVSRFNLYNSHPIGSTVKLIANESVKFPSVTLCPGSPNYMSPVMMKLREEKANKTGTQACDIHPYTFISDFSNISSIWKEMNLEGRFTEAISWNEYFVTQYDMPAIPKFKFNSVFTTFGNCYQTHFDELVPFQNEDYKIYFPIKPEVDICQKLNSVLYLIHSPEELIEHKIFGDHRKLSRHQYILYSLSAKVYKVLNRTEQPCDTHLTVSECEKNCIESVFKSLVPCKLPSMSIDLPFCGDPETTMNVSKKTNAIISVFDYAEECKCPKKCEEVVYYDYLKLIIGRTVHSNIGFYFGDDKIEIITEFYAYPFISLICDIGGNLGLFLGLCIPTMIDIVIKVFEGFYKMALGTKQ